MHKINYKQNRNIWLFDMSKNRLDVIQSMLKTLCTTNEHCKWNSVFDKLKLLTINLFKLNSRDYFWFYVLAINFDILILTTILYVSLEMLSFNTVSIQLTLSRQGTLLQLPTTSVIFPLQWILLVVKYFWRWRNAIAATEFISLLRSQITR